MVGRHDHVVDVVRRADVHPQLALGELRLEGAPAEALGRAHRVVGEPQRVQRLQDRQAVGVVEVGRGRCGGGVDHRAAERVDVRGEVPAAVVVGAVVAPALDAVAELGDGGGVRLHLGPGGRRVVRVQAGLGEELPVVDQALGVVGGRQAVDRLARRHVRHRAGHDRVEVRHGRRVDVRRDVRRLACRQNLRQVGEVGVEEVGLGSGPQHRGERGGRLTRVVVDAVDGDVRVGLLEDRDVFEPLLVLLRLLGRCGGAQSMLIVTGAAAAGRRRCWCRRCCWPCCSCCCCVQAAAVKTIARHGGDRDYRAIAQSVTLSALHRSIPFLGLNVGDVRPRRRDESVSAPSPLGARYVSGHLLARC